MAFTTSLIAVFPDWAKNALQEGDQLTHDGMTWVVDKVNKRDAWVTVVELRPQAPPADARDASG